VKVIIIGTIPPPIGGVSIHIDRFLNLYKDNSKFELAVLDLKKKTLFIKNKKIKNIFKIILSFLTSKIVHIHISNSYVELLFTTIGKILFKKVIYTHHNIIVRNRYVFKLMYQLCNKVILVNDKEIDRSLININKTKVIPAFLQPYKLDKLPSKLEDEMKSYNQIISTNCFFYNLIDGKHVYGFDLIVNAFYKLSQEAKIKDTLLILVDPSNTTKEFVTTLLKQKNFYTNKVLLQTEKLDFVSLVKKSNITIRATRTDGDSLSIRESLYFNIPIICSDVIVRPKGVVLFNSDDSDDLSDKILSTIKNKNNFKYEHIDYGKQILDLYNELTEIKNE